MLKKGYAELDPQVACVNADACTGCGKCERPALWGRADILSWDGKDTARIDAAGCKGCGGCVPVCPHDAIDLLGYSDTQIKAMIDGLLKERV